MSDYAAFSVPSVASGQQVAVTTTSAQSTALREGDWICVVTALTFVLRGSNPTATSTGTSPALAPNVPYTLRGIQEGDKLAFIAPTGTATAYLWPAQ